jgi:hypothetical protein
VDGRLYRDNGRATRFKNDIVIDAHAAIKHNPSLESSRWNVVDAQSTSELLEDIEADEVWWCSAGR